MEKIRRFVRSGRRDWTLNTGSHLDTHEFNHRVVDNAGPITDKDVPDADIVIATWWETAEWVSKLRPAAGVKLYFIQHHEVFPYLPVDRCRATYRLPMRKIVVAKWLKEVMATEYGDGNAQVVPNAVDRSLFFADVRQKQQRPTVGFMFARAGFKGLDTTLNALKIVRRTHPQLHLLSFGTENPGKRELPVGTEFIFSPAQEQIRNIYSRCDVWMTASRTEGFNLPAMEAMSCRTPVVSTRTGWPNEAIQNGINGRLVEIDDAGGLANAALWILSLDNEKWRAVSDAAYQTVSASSWQESARQFEEALFRAYTESTAENYSAC
jgi:glycosyltransferase involved in cell wall biosynthesis